MIWAWTVDSTDPLPVSALPCLPVTPLVPVLFKPPEAPRHLHLHAGVIKRSENMRDAMQIAPLLISLVLHA
jgi:hypothetical protein